MKDNKIVYESDNKNNIVDHKYYEIIYNKDYDIIDKIIKELNKKREDDLKELKNILLDDFKLQVGNEIVKIKDEIRNLKSDMKKEIHKLKSDMKKEIQNLKSEVKNFEKSKSELKRLKEIWKKVPDQISKVMNTSSKNEEMTSVEKLIFENQKLMDGDERGYR